MPVIVGAALVDSINPCAISVLFLTIAFLFSAGKLRKSVLKIGGAYIFGVFLVYILIGLGILQTLNFFGIPNFLGKFAAILLIIFGSINVLGDQVPSFPIKLKIPKASHKKIAALMEKSSVPSSFALGAFVGLAEFPCTGGPYLAVLSLLHGNSTFLKGLFYLIIYNAIFVLPLVLILFGATSKVALARIEKWKKQKLSKTKLVSGLVFIGLGVILFVI